MEYNSYLAELNFRNEKILLRIKQSSNIKNEILKHIKENQKQFTNIFKDLICLENSGDLRHLEYNYNKNEKFDIVGCQILILDDIAGNIDKMFALYKYYKSLEQNDKEDIIKAL